MKQIKLTQRKYALVDDGDFEWLSRIQWRYHSKGYAVGGKTGRALWMHRIIANTPDGMFTDHIDGDKLNNQRGNLRVATKAQNGWNSVKPKNNTSGYKGVSWNCVQRKWVARICINGKILSLGYFSLAIEADRAYNEAVKQYHGEFARLN